MLSIKSYTFAPDSTQYDDHNDKTSPTETGYNASALAGEVTYVGWNQYIVKEPRRFYYLRLETMALFLISYSFCLVSFLARYILHEKKSRAE